jgi:broad specificity phosphatase PhoE
MAQLVLIKHSAVVVDATVPPREWPLSDDGRRLCRPLAAALRMHELGVLVSSEEPKAVETAELVARRLSIETRTATGLDEHRRPFIDTPDEFERLMERFFAEPDERVFGEESAAEALARFTAAIDAVLASEPNRNAGIVAHGTVIALYAAPMFDVGAGALWERLQMPSFVVVDTESRRGLRIVDEIEP